MVEVLHDSVDYTRDDMGGFKYRASRQPSCHLEKDHKRR